MPTAQNESGRTDDDDVEKKEESNWIIVAAAFTVNFIGDGLMFCFGILLIELIDAFKGTRASTALVGALLTAFLHLIGPVAGSVCDVYGSRWVVVLGSLVAFAGLFASVFVNSIPVLCVTFGVISGTGIGLMYTPVNACVMKHFNKRRALASGIATCGTGLGTVVMNLSIGYLSMEYGWRGAVLIASGLMLNGIACGLALPKTNKSPSRVGKDDVTKSLDESNKQLLIRDNDGNKFRRIFSNMVDCSVMRDFRCVAFLSSTFFVGLAFGVPFSLLPDQVSEEGMDEKKAAWLVSSIGITNTISRLLLGWFGDRAFVNRLVMLEMVIVLGGVSLAISPLLTTFETKLIFTCSFGVFIGGYVMLLPVVLSDLFGPEVIGKTFGLNIFIAGLTSLFATPIGGWIFDQTGSYTVAFVIAGVEFFIGGALLLVPDIINKCSKKDMHVSVELTSYS